VSYDYPHAGDNAQPEVKEAIERFLSLSEKERAKMPLLYWLLGEGTPNYKVSAKDSEYTDVSKDKKHTCANCEWFFLKVANHKGICSKIEPYVKAEGWCNRWTEIKKEGTRERDNLKMSKIADKIASEFTERDTWT
jgi:hypothetical protein